jgi:aryl-alcohol dehydrogenase-like predicted oxidoreductase
VSTTFDAVGARAMELRRLGRTGLVVSALGYGGAPIGFAPGGKARRGDFVAVVRRAAELGVTFFDTAPDYRESESILAEALVDVPRVVIATKVGRRQVRDRGSGAWIVTEDWSRDEILRSVDRSVDTLGRDPLDLVQLHSPPIEVIRAGEAARALHDARDRGLVRHVGVSADGADARAALDFGGFETLQISYNQLDRYDADEIIGRASELGLGVIVKQPIANGRMGDGTAEGLRWLLSDTRVSTAIVGTTSIEHLEQNVLSAVK